MLIHREHEDNNQLKEKLALGILYLRAEDHIVCSEALNPWAALRAAPPLGTGSG